MEGHSVQKFSIAKKKIRTLLLKKDHNVSYYTYNTQGYTFFYFDLRH